MQYLKLSKKFDILARVLLSAVFINAIPLKIANFNNVVAYISSKGISEPISTILLIIAILFLSIGSVLVITGKYEKEGALFLLAFLIPTTIIFHLNPFETRAVLMNLGLIGGLLLLYIR